MGIYDEKQEFLRIKYEIGHCNSVINRDLVKIIKNNESIKFFDKKIFQNLSYKFDQKRTKILLEENSNNDLKDYCKNCYKEFR